MIKKTGLFLLMVLFANAGFPQKVMLLEGDLSGLKEQKDFIVEFQYENIRVGKGLTEEFFVSEKKQMWEQKEAGKGDEWEGMWFGSRKSRFEPAFLAALARETGWNTMATAASYTLILKTTFIEPGWTVGVLGVVANIEGEAWIVNSVDRKVIARLQLTNIKGKDYNGGDFEMGRRLRQTYENAGVMLGWYFRKNLKLKR